MRETVLLYNFKDDERKKKLTKALLPLGFRLKTVAKEDYLKPIGFLAGLKDMEDNGSVYEGEEFQDEMMLMAGFTSARVDTLLSALRKNGVGRINYKAVLTETNKSWDSVSLFREIKREHEYMTGGQKGAETPQEA
ncbi:MAG: DUF3783 domain-containing protein [Clostridium sp.]|nr:DUF3783 domain-containing protein [Clostridium sp.]